VNTSFWWGNLREGKYINDLGVDGRIKLKWIFDQWAGGMDLIDLS
jgi:hypothetical protein